ncbi:hypothetical protein [Halobellus ruber]|uniref:hypothetical protein n=1 Tax=Halobellus ruber TaxID=2761102 RepID=UPI001FEC7FA2|nr:hypothetical protein [Halobellus ruber]
MPEVILGAIAAHSVPTTLLKLLFDAGLLVLGGFPVYYEPGEPKGEYRKQKNTGRGTTTVESAHGETVTYDTCWRPPGVGLATVGGSITGLISDGTPEVTTPN